MVAFALVNTPAAGYFIASDVTNMGWRELPHDLADEVEDVRRNGEEIMEVSIGQDGDWFLRTNARHSCWNKGAGAISNVELFVKLALSNNLDLSQYTIQFFTFVPDHTGYVCLLLKDDGSMSQCAWRNVPRDLDDALSREGSKGIRHVAVGARGSFVIIMNSGALWWMNLPAPLTRLLEEAERTGRAVQTVSLSLVNTSWYYVRFADGAAYYSLPPAWSANLVKYCSHLPSFAPSHSMTTAYHTPQTPQLTGSSFYTPPPQYAPYQTPMYTSSPPQNSYTNVYVQSPPPWQPEPEKGSSKMELLTGGLKVVGAVLSVVSVMSGLPPIGGILTGTGFF